MNSKSLSFSCTVYCYAVLFALMLSGLTNKAFAQSISYDFNEPSDMGFTTQNHGPTSQEWERGEPTGSGINAPSSANSQPFCWGTNLSGDMSPEASYSLLSPEYLITDTQVNFSFYEHVAMDPFSNAEYHDAIMYYRLNGGGWVQIYEHPTNMAHSWTLRQDTVSGLTIGDTIQFRWHAESDGVGEEAGWYIDDLSINNVTGVDAIDVGLFTLISPAESNNCGSSESLIQLKLFNNGHQSQDSIPLFVDIYQNGILHASVSGAHLNNLSPYEIDTATVGTADLSAGGIFEFIAYTQLAGDSNQLNDTITATVEMIEFPETPIAQDAYFCGSGVYELSASSSQDLIWYDVASGGQPLSFDSMLTTPFLDTTTTFYVVSEYQSCEGDRLPVTAFIQPLPEISTNPGAVFEGVYNDGTLARPDKVCAGNTLMYELIPPDNFSNFDYGTGWEITDYSFETAYGTEPVNVSVSPPGPTSNAVLNFTANTLESDSVFIINIDVINLSTGCEATYTRAVIVNPVPEVSFTADDVCDGNAVEFNNGTTLISGSLDYEWHFGEQSTSNDENPIHIYADYGVYDVKLIAVTDNLCTDSLSLSIEVYPLPIADYIFAGERCEGEFEFANISSAGTATASYMWNFNDGNTSSDSSPVHQFEASGIYQVSLVVTNEGGCTDTSIQEVIVDNKPIASFDFEEEVCVLETVNFDNTTDSMGYEVTSYLWDFGDTETSTLINPQHTYSDHGIYNVTLAVMLSNGCSDTAMHSILVHDLPSAQFSVDQQMHTVTLTPVEDFHLNYLWDFGDNNTSTDMIPTHTYSSNDIFEIRLEVESEHGCESTSVDTVEIKTVSLGKIGAASANFKVYPNPMHENAVIKFSLEKTSVVSLKVYDILGRTIKVFTDHENLTSDTYEYELNSETEQLLSGVYIIKLQVNDNVFIEQLNVVR